LSETSHIDTAMTRYQCAVFRVLNCHSLLDLNLGLCIAHLSEPKNPPSAYGALERLSCSGKIEALRKLVPSEMARSLDRWAHTAMNVRAVRNQFAHGVWEYSPLNKSAPVGLRMPPWFASGDDAEFRFAVSEVETQADEMKACFVTFMEWRRHHSV